MYLFAPLFCWRCHWQDGADELGVLLYGHARNAYWFGSRLTIAQATALAPHQNATGLQAREASSFRR
jgi:homospermidine synthase